MIGFSCSQCGLKMRVKHQFAGRSGKCPNCQQRFVVPQPEATVPVVPAGRLEGAVSSLAQAGLDPGVSLDPRERSPADPGQRSVRDVLAQQSGTGQRYVIEGEIARGGMGAVLRAVDCDIRREVAVKFLLNQADAKSKARFVEEAQITGQLEHPNIPPVHELGMDAQRRLFFAMKMVRGRSLAQVLDQLRQTPRSAEREWPLTRLLHVLVNVCNALAYAHSRGVIHRDLKPANIMIGDFGEVYLMDWGLAKVLASDPASGGRQPPEQSLQSPAVPSGGLRPPLAASNRIAVSRDQDIDMTQQGSVVGTPVYMPPEQAMGKVDAIEERSDIYSLGAILYEILTLVPPIDKEGGYLSVLVRVSEGQVVVPEQRAPQRAGRIPKELSAIAMKALAKDPKDRYPSAEAVRRDIERFLEGRSVSAKADTKWEVVWKFVKRNQGFSVGMAAALAALVASLFFVSVDDAVIMGTSHVVILVLIVGLFLVSRTNAQYKAERKDREAAMATALPALLEAARLMLEQGRPQDSLALVTAALAYDPNGAEAHSLKGEISAIQTDSTAPGRQ